MELAAEKEAEAQRLRTCYVEQLQAQTARAEVAARREELLRRQLEADFQFNLQLVGERDAELARYEAAVAELRQAVNSLTAESSELRVALAEREAEVVREKEERQQVVVRLHAEMDTARKKQSAMLADEQRRCDEVRRALEARLRAAEGESERAKTELTAHFEDEAQNTEQKHRAMLEQLEGAVMETQSQVRAREREMEKVRHCLEAAEASTKSLRERVEELEKQKRAQEWAWQERVAVMETNMERIRMELENSQSTAKSCQSHLQHKCSELDQQVREKGQCLQKAKECWAEREAELVRSVWQLTEERKVAEREKREEKRSVVEQLKEKELEIEKLQREVAGRTEREEELSKQLLLAKAERDELQPSLTSARAELLRAKQSARALEERLVKDEGQWREKVRETERTATAHSQKTLQTLSQDRDKLVCEVRSLRDKVSEQQTLIDRVCRERDVAIATLNSYSLQQNLPESLRVVKGEGTALQEGLSCEVLSQQNATLRAAVSSMRSELERLCAIDRPGSGGQPQQRTAAGRREGKPPSGQASQREARLERGKMAAEQRASWLERALSVAERRLRETEEEMFQLRAVMMSPERCQEKLLQATRAIICLLRDRDSLLSTLQTGVKGQQVGRHSEEIPPSTDPSLQFTDSDVECRQRSFEQLVMGKSLSASPLPVTSEPPGTDIPSPPGPVIPVGEAVAMEMHGIHIDPLPRKPHKWQRSHALATNQRGTPNIVP